MNRRLITITGTILLAQLAGPRAGAADDTIATAVSSRIGNGYKRGKLKDGSFKPEFYALSNGGRIYGTTSDITVDRVTYPQVAEITMRLLEGQKYHYAKSAGEAKLLLTLYWGNTIGFDRPTYAQSANSANQALETLKWMRREGKDKLAPAATGVAKIGSETAENYEESVFETEMLRILMDNRVRDRLTDTNAQLLGYTNDLNAAQGPQRWAGAGDHYTDLITDVEESRYYIVILAYDFEELTKRQKKKLLWTTRVSVRTPGNRFDDSYAAMLKVAAKYFGQDSGKLIRGEESKGVVELGDLKFLGEAKNVEKDKPAAVPVKAEPTSEDKK